ncbi:MAG TPA: glycosyltransferase [Herpetosiphonaceae bacterium]|nr:glycosyltransferase [Herpetosiphonaceae bacterium]
MTVGPRTFLFVTWEGGGNVPPILGVARRLIKRGHVVRVISDPCNEHDVRAVGASFVPYTRAPHRHDKDAASTLVKDYAEKNSAASFRVWLDTIACGPALAYAQDVHAELEQHPADVVVVSELLFGGLFAAEKAGVPCTMVVPGTYTLPAPGMPPPGMLPMTGIGGWLRDRLARFMVERFFGTQLPALQHARLELGLPPLDRPLAYIEQLDRVLVLTSHAFEFAATFPANVRVVGPILDDPAWTAPWQSPWPADHQDPLVVVGFSTTFQNHRPQVQRVIDALTGWPVRGLVTLGPALQPADFHTPPNVVLCESAPHTQVFPHACAVVTHAGHGTVIRALAHGVPLVCMPLGRDQPGNAARVVFHEAGLRLASTVPVETIRRTIQRVVSEPLFRDRAQKLGQLIKEEAQAETAIAELEQLAEQRPVRSALLPPLHEASRSQGS